MIDGTFSMMYASQVVLFLSLVLLCPSKVELMPDFITCLNQDECVPQNFREPVFNYGSAASVEGSSTLNYIIYWIEIAGLSYQDANLTVSIEHNDSVQNQTLNFFSGIYRPRPLKQRFNIKRKSSYLIVLLILAGDTELNPGPRPIKYPCLICKKAAKWGQNCLQCDQCSGWYHIDCMQMPTYLYEANANSSMSWLCCECGLPNISPSVFHTLSGISTSNSFSSLSDTTSSHDSSTDLGPPIATSSPNADSGGNARNAGHSRQKRKLKAIVLKL